MLFCRLGVFIKEIMALTTSIPMVGATADPVAFGFTSSLARPDQNFTGVVVDAGLEIWAKRVQLLLEAARKVTKLGFLVANPTASPPNRERTARTSAKPHSEVASRRLKGTSKNSRLLRPVRVSL